MEQHNLKKLEKYSHEGYLFHGSPDGNVDQFEPRKASDLDKSSNFNNDNAIFLAVDFIAAIAFSLINTKNKNWPKDKIWKIGPREEFSNDVYMKLPIEVKELFKNKNGYVYVFERTEDMDNGVNVDWQVKAKKNLTPVDKVEVNFSDLEFFQDRIEWI